MKTYFCMIGKGDVPVYEANIASHHMASKLQKEDLIEFIVHASLDSIDAKLWTTSSMFFKNVDKFNDVNISAFVTAGHMKLILLHDHRTEENAIKQFFLDVYELYIKWLMNPFYEKNSSITSRAFDERVKHLADKYLTK